MVKLEKLIARVLADYSIYSGILCSIAFQIEYYFSEVAMEIPPKRSKTAHVVAESNVQRNLLPKEVENVECLSPLERIPLEIFEKIVDYVPASAKYLKKVCENFRKSAATR